MNMEQLKQAVNGNVGDLIEDIKENLTTATNSTLDLREIVAKNTNMII